MSKAGENKDIQLSIQRYLSGAMSPEERNAFEREMQKDPFLAEAVDGLATIAPEDAEKDIAIIKDKINPVKPARRFLLYRIAAITIVMLGISSILFVRQLRQPALLSENLEPLEDTAGYFPNTKEVVEDIAEDKKIEEPLAKKEEDYRETEAEAPPVVLKDETVKSTEDTERSIKEPEKVMDREEFDVASVEARENISGVSRPSTLKTVDIARKSATKKMIKGRTLASDDSLPLPGVAISIKGTSRGVTSDLDGNFLLEADTGDILVADYTGMKSAELRVENNKIEDIMLEPDKMALEEVVVVGYAAGKDKTVSQTGAVSEISLDKESPSYHYPAPVAGMREYREYIEDNIRFPADWDKSDREVVRIRFTVEVDGELSNFELVRSPDTLFSVEAIRLIQEGPAWSPAIVNMNPVQEKASLRIVFRR